MNSGVTSSNKKSERFVWIDGSVPIEKKLLDHLLHDGTSSETIMHIALVDASVETASLNGTLGVAEVIHVQLLEKRMICVIKQRIDLLLRGRRQSTLGSSTLSANMGNGKMISAKCFT